MNNNSDVYLFFRRHNSTHDLRLFLPICISAVWSNLPRCSAAALQALKRKKRYEKQLAQIDGTLSTIEFQRDALENANTNTEVLKNIGYAAKAMKNAHANL